MFAEVTEDMPSEVPADIFQAVLSRILAIISYGVFFSEISLEVLCDIFL